MRTGGRVADQLDAFRRTLGDNDVMAYVTMMAVRLIELHSVLKPEGTIYLHCDPTAGHYLKILMDAVFGPERFGAELVWKRTNARGTPANWPHIHDTIFYYAKGVAPIFRSLKVKADKAKLPHTLITGDDGKKYQTYELTAPGATKEGPSGKPWRGFDPNKWGRHWANSHEQMDEWDAAGLIHWPKDDGFPRRRDEDPFDPEGRMVTVGDVWTDIDRLNQTAKERLGYPTQKPLALLERIIEASSNPGDLVLDPFCGCGTTVHAAQKLGRQWIGIDITHLAIGLIEYRLKDAFGITPTVIGAPEDAAGAIDLWTRDPFQFEAWAVTRLLGIKPNERKVGDKGIDGVGRFYLGRGSGGQERYGKVYVSVKGGRHLGVGMVRDFRGALERERADLGVFICHQTPTKPMIAEAASAGRYREIEGSDIPKIQFYTVQEYFDGKRPYLPRTLEDSRRRAEQESRHQPNLI